MIGCFDSIEPGEKGVEFKRLETGLDIKKVEQQEEISLEMYLKKLEEEKVLQLNQEESARENFLMKKDSEDFIIIRAID